MAWEAGGMDLAALQMFQMVASERSYSRAAVKLFRTQPAIRMAMRKLEDWVGQPLFVRGSGARTLTDAGTLLLEYAERMLNMREEIRKGLQELRGLERGQLSLGVNESSIHALLPALEHYRRLHPGIHIRVHRVFSREVPRELLNHQLDIGVITYLPEERELTTAEFYRDALVLVVWRGHHRAGRRNFCRAYCGIALSPPRDATVRQAQSPAADGSGAADHRKHQTFRGNEKGRGHRAAHVRGRRTGARRFARIAHQTDAAGAETLFGVPAGSPAHRRGARLGGHYSSAQEDAGERQERRAAALGFASQLIEGCAHARQAPAHIFRLSPHADAKVFRHFEKAAGHDAGFVLVAQQLAESVRVAAGKLRKRNRSGFGPDRQQVSAALKKFFQQSAIGHKQLLRARGYFRQMLESQHAEQLDRMRRHHAEQIVQPPHALRQRFRGKNPAAA